MNHRPSSFIVTSLTRAEAHTNIATLTLEPTKELSLRVKPTTEVSTPDRPSGPLLEEQFGTSELSSNKGLPQSIGRVRAQFIMSEEVIATKTKANIAISTSVLNEGLQDEQTVDPLCDLSHQFQVIESTENNIHSASSADENTRDQFVTNMEVVIDEDKPNNNADANTDVNDAEVADIIAHPDGDSLEEITVYEVVTEYQTTSTATLANYPHIFLQLHEGQIINVESGEVVISLSQFLAPNETNEPSEIEIYSTNSSQLSPRPLKIDSDHATSTQEIDDQQVKIDDTLSTSYETLSQTLLAHEETVMAESTMEDVEGEVVREVRSLISDRLPEGWIETDQRMFYNTNESEWGSEGISDDEMQSIKQHHACKIPTNADCIKYLYDYEETDDPKIPDHLYYRHCKRPTTMEEIYRRWSFRLRRRAYFARPAIYVKGHWWPELYLSDPEDPEWSWKEGIEVDRPAQSLYQLNEGKVFWDPFKHLRVCGVHPYYKWPAHESLVDRSLPPNPIRHVKRPTEQLMKFSVQRFPHSHFTTREPPDAVQYHPSYKGFRPLGDGSTTSDLVDLTQNNPMFWPPPGQEWFIPVDDKFEHNNDQQASSQAMATIENTCFDNGDMLPYLSPTSLSTKEEEAVQESMASNWGCYHETTTNPESLKQWQAGNLDMGPESITPVTTTPREALTLSPINSINPGRSNVSSMKPYVIPKLPKGISSTKVNELVAKVSPPARPILPKPSSMGEQSSRSLYNTSGLRSTQRPKKKK